MKLKRITVRNFMPFRGPMDVEFPLEERKNVMIVFGDNMRGKTSFLNALRWGFYGAAIGRHGKAIQLHDIVNHDAAREGDWSIDVFIELEANGYSYELRRVAQIRSHVAKPSRNEDFSVDVHLRRNGIVVSGDQVKQEIEQFAPEQVSRFFLFDGELLQQYEELLIEGSEQGRQIKESIEQVLGVPALINGRDQLGSIVKSATKQQSNEMALIHGLEKQAERQAGLTARQDSFERDYARLVARYAEVRDQRLRLEDDLDAAAEILALKAQLDGAKTRLALHTKTRDEKTVERLAVIGSAWRDVLVGKIELKRTQLTTRQAALTEGLKTQGRLQSTVDTLSSLLANAHCPTCDSKLDHDHRQVIGTRLGSAQGELEMLADQTEELQRISAQISSLNKIKAANVSARLASIDKDLRFAGVEEQRAENEIERLVEQIAGHDTAELARKRALHNELSREEGRLSGEISQVQKSIDGTKDELAIAQRVIQSMATNRMARVNRKVSIATALERTFAVSIERLRDTLRERVSAYANDAFAAMTTQKTYSGLEINKNYGLKILDRHGKPVPIRSAGAEQIVALSLIDGLNRTGRAIGPVVMDTPFGRLDLNHRDNILAYLPKVTSQFILLVHSGEIRPETDLESVKARIGATYKIREISSSHSEIVRVTV